MAYITFEHIVKKFGENTVLNDINLTIEKGRLVTLLGPSGCGKSTLLRCLAGLEGVTEGRIFLDGRDITNVDPRRREMGMVFQQYSLFPNMTVLQNVEFGLKLKKWDKRKRREAAERMIGIVGLDEKRDSYPSQLSGGQQQRAALARAIVMKPKVLLLDEPLSAIDALLRKSLQTEIRRIQRELGITAIFVTHDQEEAMVMSDEIHLLHDGKIEQSAKPAELYKRPATLFAASFIGSYNLIPGGRFAKLVGERVECAHVAIRPETLAFAEEGRADGACYGISGTIENATVHGNILRYLVRAGEETLNVDRLFGGGETYAVGDACRLLVKKEECVYF